MDAIRARRRCGSASTRWAAPASPTGRAIAERYGLDLTVVNPPSTRPSRFMTRRLGRQDPDGLLVAVRDGGADRAEGPLRRRVRQRRRRRPPRHRHARRRPAEPEPLPRGRDRLPVPAPPGLAGRRRRSARRWCQQQHDRPRRAPTSAGRLLEVPVGFKWFVAGPARRLARLRRRGERGRVVPAPRRRASGRPTRTASSCACSPPRSPRSTGRDPGELYAELTERFGDPVYERIDAPATPEQKAVLGKLSPPTGARRPSWPASRSSRS